MGKTAIDKYNAIKLNGVYRQGKELVDFCNREIQKEETSEWLTQVYQFILQWLSPDEYIIAQTSGSTGKPKQIRLLKQYMVASAHKTICYFNLQPAQTVLLCLSANFIAGKMMIVRAFVGQFNLLMVEPNGHPLVNICQPVDFAAMIPLQVSNSIKSFSLHDLVKIVIIGGGALTEKLKSKIADLTVDFYETYGMTETVSHVAIRKISFDKYFIPMPNVFFSVDDRQCLVINAPDILKEEIITNDLVELNHNGSFVYLGRYDNVINSGGIKIMPEVVENKLSAQISVPFIISSIDDEKLGEKLVLVVEAGIDIKNIEELILNTPKLTKFEKPKKVVSIDSFPLTDTQKINRGKVKSIISDSQN